MQVSGLPKNTAAQIDTSSESAGNPTASYAALTNAELIADSSEKSHPHSEPCCASNFFARTKMAGEYGFKGWVASQRTQLS